ncbi:MAG TPA: carbonate dehydratase [Gammaproteobacteria bacterium]|nr:carbonate dehydratase [Gammaproteobacteria bacterium]
MEKLKKLFAKNKEWAKKIKQEDPDFFAELSKKQTPKYLWIGCSDSRVPENKIVDLPAGEIFVHRNIANMVVHTDLNSLSVIQYAVEVLEIKHIIVCGHYGCGGIKAAMENHEHGLIDNWLRHIKDVRRFHEAKLTKLDHEKKLDRLCELNVIEQVRNICNTTIVQDAWRADKELHIHGWVYSLANGRLKSLENCISSNDELQERNKKHE